MVCWAGFRMPMGFEDMESFIEIKISNGLWLKGNTPQKSNELIPKIAIFKGSYLFQTIILGIHVSFRECNLHKEGSK